MGDARGVAQLIVLWALLLLGTLALSFSFAMRTEALAARNGLDAARAYYQARTGISRAIMRLSGSPSEDVRGETLAGGEEDASYETRITGEGGKIDINFVPEGVLKEVLRNGGLPPDEAEGLGDAILDWRDDDDMPRPNGAEGAYYASIPAAVKPTDGRLASVDELLSVKGVTPELYGRLLSRVFTVHGVSPAVDVNAAPVEVLRLLPGFTPEAAVALVSVRREARFRSPADVSAFLAANGVPMTALPLLSTANVSRIYTIDSVGRAGGGITRGVACRVEVGGAGKSVKILRWVDYIASGEGA